MREGKKKEEDGTKASWGQGHRCQVDFFFPAGGGAQGNVDDGPKIIGQLVLC